MLVVRCLLLVVCCSLFVFVGVWCVVFVLLFFCRLLFGVGSLLVVACCWLCVVRYSLFVVCCLLYVVVRCLPVVVCCRSLIVVCCLLFC